MTIQIHSNDTLTTNGSQVHTRITQKDLILTINIKGTPTGTTPGIVFTLQEVDPADLQTPIGIPSSSAVLTAPGFTSITLRLFTTAVRVSWTVTGTNAVFPQVYAALIPVSNPVVFGYDQNWNARGIRTDELGRLTVLSDIGAGPFFTTQKEAATYMVSARDITLGNNKSLLSLHNTSATLRYCVHQVYLINVLTTNAVTGVIASFELRRLTGTAPTGGTDLSTTGVEAFDTADTLAPLPNFSVRTGATVVGESSKVLFRSLWSTDEWSTGTLDMEAYDHAQQTHRPLWGKDISGTKPLVLRQNQGVTVKCATNTTLGTWDIFALVTLES